jgi:hypothetical protein
MSAPLVEEQGENDDDRQRHAKQKKKQASAHGFLP